MKMCFHGGIVDIILFRGWAPRTGSQYALSCLAVILMVVVTQAGRVSATRIGPSPPSPSLTQACLGAWGSVHVCHSAPTGNVNPWRRCGHHPIPGVGGVHGLAVSAELFGCDSDGVCHAS
jgi:hypothetical protein